MLFVSRAMTYQQPQPLYVQFQSRNRDAFRFKFDFEGYERGAGFRFNLGIEMLFVSRIWSVG